jgi:glycosyltransferase involved in cell wall biosynthesis
MDSVVKPENCPSVSVIMCALNEAENLAYVLPKIPRWVDEIIMVDGRSIDGTVEVAQKLRPNIRVLIQKGKGKGDALKYGFQQVTGEIIVTMDADGATDAEAINYFIQPLLNGYDMTKGSRLVHGRPTNMPFHRWVGNKILSVTFNILYGTNYSDICSGYNAFRKPSLQCLHLTFDGFEMEQELIAKASKTHLKIIEVEHHDTGRLNSTSKVSGLKQGLKDWIVIVKERFHG